MKPFAAALAWLYLLAPAAAPAAGAEGLRFLEPLAATWDMRGAVRGRSVHYRARGRWILAHGWLEFSMTDLASPSGYEARLYLGYDPQAHDFVAHWLDRFGAAGARVVATGALEGRTLVLMFPYSEGAFRDTLTLADGGRSATLLLESQASDGSWSVFARYDMERSGRAPVPSPRPRPR